MTDSLEVKDDEDMKETSSRSGKGYTSYHYENKDVFLCNVYQIIYASCFVPKF